MPIIYESDGSVTLQSDADPHRVDSVAARSTNAQIDAVIEAFFAADDPAG